MLFNNVDPSVDDIVMPNGQKTDEEQQNIFKFDGGNKAPVKKFSICFSKFLPL